MRGSADGLCGELLCSGRRSLAVGRLCAFGLVYWFLTLASVSDAQVVRDGSLGPPGGALHGPDFLVGADLGSIRGSNLFHSFSEFNVLAGESATFTGPSSIANILSRVTGQNLSRIDGLLRSEIPGANFYLINPRGVVFGPNAALDIGASVGRPGSFHASTADYLLLQDGVRFTAVIDAAKDAVLTSEPVIAFGFLSPNPGTITVEGSFLAVGEMQTLSLIGGSISMLGGGLTAPSGRVNLAAVASPGEVRVNASPVLPGITMDAGMTLAPIELSLGALLDASDLSGFGSGSVVVRGGRLVLDGASITANTFGDVDASNPGIDLHAAESLALSNGALIATSASGFGRGGDIHITTPELILNEGTVVKTETLGDGNSGDVILNVGTARLLNGAVIFTSNFSFGVGQGGSIVIRGLDGSESRSQLVELTGRSGFDTPSEVLSETLFSGAGGRISVQTDSLRMDDGARIRSSTFGDGAGGEISLAAGELALLNGSQIRSETVSAESTAGRGGDITVAADRSALISGTGPGGESGIFSSSAFGPATPGNITGMFGALTLTDAAIIESGNAFDSTGGGSITLTATESLTVSNGSRISNQAPFSTDAGPVSITAPSLTIDNGFITTSTLGEFRGGDVTLNVGSLSLTNGSRIVASSETFASGAGGDIRVQGRLGSDTAAEVVSISGRSIDGLASGLFSTASGTGDAGTISMRAERVTLSDGAKISVATAAEGKAGGVTLTAETLDVKGGTIDSSTTGSGAGGDIALVTTGALSLSGSGAGIFSTASHTGAGGSIAIQADSARILSGGEISAKSTGEATAHAGTVNLTVQGSFTSDQGQVTTSATAAKGGDITLSASTIELVNQTEVSARTTGSGDAGHITVTATTGDLLVQNSTITTESQAGAGGAITVSSPTAVTLTDATISATVHGGERTGGAVSLTAPLLTMNGGSVQSRSEGEGSAGSITATVQELALAGGARFNSSTTGEGDGGSISVLATGPVSMTGATTGLVSTTSGTGRGGNIEVQARSLDLAGGAEISASSTGTNTAHAGTIRIGVTEGLTSTQGSITTSAVRASGGSITVDAATIDVNDHSRVSARTEGRGDAGSVELVGSRTLTVTGSAVTTEAFEGAGGSISLTAGSELMLAGSSVSATVTGGTKPGGSIVASAPVFTMTGGTMAAETRASGRAGSVELNVGTMRMTSGAEITSSSTGSADGAAGAVTVQGAGGAGTVTESVTMDAGTLLTKAEGSGAGGSIVVHASSVTLDRATISATSRSGDAGSIAMPDTRIFRSTDSSVTTEAETGKGGSIAISAAERMDLLGTTLSATVKGGTQLGGVITLATPWLSMAGGSVQSRTQGAGAAGTVLADVGRLTLGDGAQFNSSSESAGSGGNVVVTADGTVTLSGSGTGLFSTASGSGAGGNIDVQAADVRLEAGAELSASSTGSGAGGTVTVKAAGGFTSDGGSITTSATQGTGGNISVTAAQDIRLVGGSVVSAESTGAGNAGDIRLESSTAIVIDHSAVTTEATHADGGNITVLAPSSIQLNQSTVTASVGGGVTTVGGNILIDPQYFTMRGSQIIANAFEGQGGNITITAGTFLASADSIIDASSALGINGFVDIRSPVTNLSGTLAPLPQAVQRGAVLLSQRCAVQRQGGQLSSFVVAGRDGIPAEPNGLLPLASASFERETTSPRGRAPSGLAEPAFSSGAPSLRGWPKPTAALLVPSRGCAS
ncbi:two-partner secretion domain-containing protein [Candidatus Nitrospira bockiana]